MGENPFLDDEDSMIETVEDWNDEDVERAKELEALVGTDFDFSEPEEYIPLLGEEDKDAAIEVTVQEDRLEAALYVEAPVGEGADVTVEDVLDALKGQKIVYGVDEEKIKEIIEEKQYRQLITIARGQAPVDGVNGKIKDHFPRKRELKFAKKANGGIDFKSMNLIHNVKAGDVICEIFKPEDARDGVDVFGNPVQGKRGRMPAIPQGRNVVYSEDKTQLVAACEGNLTFRQGRFHVENIYEVAGNVDNSVGNINFSGSVYIHGDVYEGYTVKCKGDITIAGIVEGAHLRAGGNILLQKGMRGMKTGILEAGGDITGKFLEDCTIYARGNVEAEYIINSTVSCEKNVQLIGRRGAFIGGRCAVFETMKVKAVGASSHTPTSITLGVTPELLENIQKTGEQLAQEKKKLIDCKKNIDYLIKKQQTASLTPIQEKRLGELKIEHPVNQLLIRQLEAKLAQMKMQVQGAGKCRLYAEEIHPGTVIQMGSAVLQVKQRESSCMFYYADGKIKKGLY